MSVSTTIAHRLPVAILKMGPLAVLPSAALLACVADWWVPAVLLAVVALLWRGGWRKLAAGIAIAPASLIAFSSFSVHHAREQSALVWVENLSSIGAGYSVLWGPGLDPVTTHAHDSPIWGLTVMQAAGPSFRPVASRGALYGSTIPRLGLTVVHEMTDSATGTWGESTTHLYQSASHLWTDRRERRKFRWSRYIPATDTLLAIEEASPYPTLLGFRPEDFRDGSEPRWSIQVPIFSFEEAQVDPNDPNIVYCRGDGLSKRIARVDIRTRAIRTVDTRPWTWSVEPDQNRNLLYVSHPFANDVQALDRTTLEVVQDIVADGMPRGVVHLADLDLLAVGTYQGRRIEFYSRNQGQWDLAATLDACAQIRSISYDQPHRALYFADACGGHRAHLPEDWRPQPQQGR